MASSSDGRESSWIKDELWKVRNFHQGFEHGFWRGMIHAGLQQFTGGRGLHDRYPSTAGYQHLKKLAELPADGGDEAASASARRRATAS